MDYKDGDTITVNGKPCRIEGGALVPVVKRGPLGGEIIELGRIKWDAGKLFYVLGHPSVMQPKNDAVDIYITNPDHSMAHEVTCSPHLLVETNIPPRPTFTPMSAGEAAKLPDIVGRWVAVLVTETDQGDLKNLVLSASESWFDSEDQILLIEGVNL